MSAPPQNSAKVFRYDEPVPKRTGAREGSQAGGSDVSGLEDKLLTCIEL